MKASLENRVFAGINGGTLGNAWLDIGPLGISCDVPIPTHKSTGPEDGRSQPRQMHAGLIWNRSSNAMCIATRDGAIRNVNPAWVQILGWEESELIGQSWWVLVHPEDSATTIQAIQRMQVGDSVEGLKNRCRCKNGAYRWCSWQLVIEPSTGDLIALGRDLTEEKQQAQQLLHAQKVESMERLVGGIAHKFNNLLSVINGYSELVLERLPDPSLSHDQLAAVHRAGEEAALLTSQFLAFCGKASCRPKTIDLNRTLGAMATKLRHVLGDRILLNMVTTPLDTTIEVDPDHLEHILFNLVKNSRDAMPAGGRLTLETNQMTLCHASAPTLPPIAPGDYVCLRVSDTGHGMTDYVRQKIFEPFFTTKGIGNGNGLGLSVSQGMIKQCGGQIDVESKIGSGTSFTIWFPVAQKNKHSIAQGSNGPRQPSSRTVLLVEVEVEVRTIARMALEKAGFIVLEASNGESALRIVEECGEAIHLLVSEVTMPQLNGLQLAEALRKQCPKVPVLFISGYASDVVLSNMMRDTSCEFLPKPFSSWQLSEKVLAMLNSVV